MCMPHHPPHSRWTQILPACLPHPCLPPSPECLQVSVTRPDLVLISAAVRPTPDLIPLAPIQEGYNPVVLARINSEEAAAHMPRATLCALYQHAHSRRDGIDSLLQAAPTPQAGRPTVLMYGHYDVKPPGVGLRAALCMHVCLQRCVSQWRMHMCVHVGPGLWASACV